MRVCALPARPGSMSRAPSAWPARWAPGTRSSPSCATTATATSPSSSIPNSCAPRACPCPAGSTGAAATCPASSKADPVRRLHLIAALIALLASVALPGTGQLAPVGAAQAQDVAQIDYDAWEKAAEQAQTSLEEDRASNRALEDMRTHIVEWRA